MLPWYRLLAPAAGVEGAPAARAWDAACASVTLPPPGPLHPAAAAVARQAVGQSTPRRREVQVHRGQAIGARLGANPSGTGTGTAPVGFYFLRQALSDWSWTRYVEVHAGLKFSAVLLPQPPQH